MNQDFTTIEEILTKLKDYYNEHVSGDSIDDIQVPITERDIVAEIYCRLKPFCKENSLSVHTEIKPAPDNENSSSDDLKKLSRIDVVILKGNWIPSAIELQNKYIKGKYEARYSSIPVSFFHTAIEVKIQSKPGDAEADIEKLKKIHCQNPDCNCFFVLLNVRGKSSDHKTIGDYLGKSPSIRGILSRSGKV